MENYLFWYIAAGVLLLAEAFTPGSFIFICFAAATLITGLIDQLNAFDLRILFLIDFLLSMLFLVTLKPFLQTVIKMPEAEAMLYSNQLVGREAMVFKEIIGSQVGGVKLIDFDETWLAKSSDKSSIEQGSRVKVVQIETNHLIVEKIL